MSMQNDPLMKPQAPDRLHYALGAMLGEEDFRTEQTYHRGRLGRALAYLHGAGTVAGLLASVDTRDGEEILQVSPGLAVDRLGRLIEVGRPRCLRLQRWYESQLADPDGRDLLSRSVRPFRTVLVTDVCLGSTACCPNTAETPERPVVIVDIFARFVVCERGKQPAFATGAFDALDAIAPSRLRDSSSLELVIRTEGGSGGGGTPPVPESGLPDLAALPTDEAKRHALLDYKMQQAWKEGTAWRDADLKLERQPWHVTGQDGSELLLARLLMEVNGTTLDRIPDVPVVCDNYLREFSYSTAELAWLATITR